MDSQKQKHHYNLLKTVEGTGWVICDALNTMVRNNINPSTHIKNNNPTTLLANNLTEIFEVISECEEPDVIDHLAEKIIEFAGNDVDVFLSYMGKNMEDNPLYKRVYEISNNQIM